MSDNGDDRHVRRSGEDYRDAFLHLLPSGPAWPKHVIDSVLFQTVDGLCEYWGFVDSRAADLLETESDPRITIEMLPDWERNWGLPDPCYQAPQSVADRQAALMARMTFSGTPSRQWYINFAAFLGYTITITEYRPFMVAVDRCGDNRVYGNGSVPYFNSMYCLGYLQVLNPAGQPVGNGELSEYPNYGLGPEGIRGYWSVHVASKGLTWFRCASGQCGVDPHLRIGVDTDLECVLDRWKPAHTQIVYDYSGMGTPSDPMAGTP